MNKQQGLVQLQGILRDKGAMADGTRKIVLECQETSPEELLEVLKLDGTIGWFVFKEGVIEEKDIPDEEVEFKNDKSPSQRLRNALWVYWEQNTSKKIPFDQYWRSFVEKKVNEIKEKLN